MKWENSIQFYDTVKNLVVFRKTNVVISDIRVRTVFEVISFAFFIISEPVHAYMMPRHTTHQHIPIYTPTAYTRWRSEGGGRSSGAISRLAVLIRRRARRLWPAYVVTAWPGGRRPWGGRGAAGVQSTLPPGQVSSLGYWARQSGGTSPAA